MVFDVRTLTLEEITASKILIEKLECTHPKLACPDCSCFEICIFLKTLREQCNGEIEKRLFHDNH